MPYLDCENKRNKITCLCRRQLKNFNKKPKKATILCESCLILQVLLGMPFGQLDA